MSFSSGTYTHSSSDFPAEAATLIESAKYNNLLNAMATALSTCILKDGTQTLTGDIPFGDNKITGLKDATLTADATNLKTIQNGVGVYVGTVGGTADVITITPNPAVAAYGAGQTFRFIAGGANTTNVTLNVNGLGAKAVTKNGATALVAGDIPSGTIVELTYDGTQFVIGNSDVASAPAVMTTQGDRIRGGASGAPERMPLGAVNTIVYSDATDPLQAYLYDIGLTDDPSLLANFTLAASVGSNALTIAIKGKNGSDPSATNPCWIAFRNSTQTTGAYTIDKMTAAKSVVLSAGSTLGCVADQKIRMYVYAVREGANDVELAICRQAIFDDSILKTTTAEGGAGAADSDILLYSASALTTKPIRLVGILEIQTNVSTAGNWDEVPSVLATWVPGMRKTGDVVQRKRTTLATATTTTATFTHDDTAVEITEGAGLSLTVAFTPTSAINILEFMVRVCFGDTGTNDLAAIALFQESVTNALSVTPQNDAGANGMSHMLLTHELVAGLITETDYTIRIGGSGATITINGNSSVREYGGTMFSEHVVQERYA